MSRPAKTPRKGDQIEVQLGRHLVTAHVVDTGWEHGNAVVDYVTLSGHRHWAYLWQVEHIYPAAPVPA